MAIVWSGNSGHMYIGIEAWVVSGPHADGKVIVHADYYIQAEDGYAHHWTYPWHWSGTGGSGSQQVRYDSTMASQPLVRLPGWDVAVWSEFGRATTATFNASLGPIWNGGTPSVSVNVTIPARPYQAPSTPSNVKGTRVNDNRIDVSWSATSTTSAPVLGTYIERRTQSDMTWRHVADVGGSARSWTDTAVRPNERYWYRVWTHSGTLWSGAAESSGISTTPAAPYNVVASKTSTSTIEVTWLNAAPYAGTGYRVYDNGNLLATVPSGQTRYVHNGASTSITHTYSVEMLEEGGLVSMRSGTSNTVQLLAPPNAPTLLQPNGVSMFGSTTFRWKHNPTDASAQQAAQIQYRPVGGSWTTLSTTSAQQTTATLSAGQYEWQVRTRGLHVSYSPWSPISTFRLVSGTTCTVTSPSSNTTITSPKLTVKWSYGQPENALQSSAEVELMQDDKLIESLPVNGTTTQAVLKTRLVDGQRYSVRVRACSAFGIWSSWSSAAFAVAFPAPPAPGVVAEWEPSVEGMKVTVTNPAPLPSTVRAYNAVFNGRGEHGTFEYAGFNMSPNPRQREDMFQDDMLPRYGWAKSYITGQDMLGFDTAMRLTAPPVNTGGAHGVDVFVNPDLDTPVIVSDTTMQGASAVNDLGDTYVRAIVRTSFRSYFRWAYRIHDNKGHWLTERRFTDPVLCEPGVPTVVEGTFKPGATNGYVALSIRTEDFDTSVLTSGDTLDVTSVFIGTAGHGYFDYTSSVVENKYLVVPVSTLKPMPVVLIANRMASMTFGADSEAEPFTIRDGGKQGWIRVKPRDPRTLYNNYVQFEVFNKQMLVKDKYFTARAKVKIGGGEASHEHTARAIVLSYSASGAQHVSPSAPAEPGVYDVEVKGKLFGPITSVRLYGGSTAIDWTDFRIGVGSTQEEADHSADAFFDGGMTQNVILGGQSFRTAWDGADFASTSHAVANSQPAVRNTIERSVTNGITWESFSTDDRLLTVVNDPDALKHGTTLYRVTAFTEAGASTSTVAEGVVPEDAPHLKSPEIRRGCSTRQVWFSVGGKGAWFPSPQVGMTANNTSWGNNTQLLNGMNTVVGSTYASRIYNMSWNHLTREQAQQFQELFLTAGMKNVFFLDPFANQNILSQLGSMPYLHVEAMTPAAYNVYGEPIAEVFSGKFIRFRDVVESGSQYTETVHVPYGKYLALYVRGNGAQHSGVKINGTPIPGNVVYPFDGNRVANITLDPLSNTEINYVAARILPWTAPIPKTIDFVYPSGGGNLRVVPGSAILTPTTNVTGVYTASLSLQEVWSWE